MKLDVYDKGSTKIESRMSQNFFLMVVLLPFTFHSFRRRFLPTSNQSIPGRLWAQFQMAIRSTKSQAVISIYEKSKVLWDFEKDHRETRNPVIESSEFAYKVDILLNLNSYVEFFIII